MHPLPFGAPALPPGAWSTAAPEVHARASTAADPARFVAASWDQTPVKPRLPNHTVAGSYDRWREHQVTQYEDQLGRWQSCHLGVTGMLNRPTLPEANALIPLHQAWCVVMWDRLMASSSELDTRGRPLTEQALNRLSSCYTGQQEMLEEQIDMMERRDGAGLRRYAAVLQHRLDLHAVLPTVLNDFRAPVQRDIEALCRGLDTAQNLKSAEAILEKLLPLVQQRLPARGHASAAAAMGRALTR